MPCCVLKFCGNHSSTINKKGQGITYHRFPVDPAMSRRWISLVELSRGEKWKPGKYSVICSDHFRECDLYVTKCGNKRLYSSAIPQLLPDYIPRNIKASLKPRTSTPVVNKDDTATEPRKLVLVVNSDMNITTTLEPPTTSLSAFEETFSINDSETPSPDFSNYIINASEMIMLKKELHKKTILHSKHTKMINAYREKIRRLQKANSKLKGIIKSLQQERIIVNNNT